MRTPFTTFPDEPTFEEIAAEWPLGGKATDADTILERLIQFMWRGDFEERRPTLFLAGAPDGCDMNANGIVTRRRPEIACDRPIDLDEQDEAELVASRVCHLYTRAVTLACLKACGFRIEGMTGSPDAMFMALAKLPLRDYDTDRGCFSVTPRRLRIRLADLAEWFDTSGLDWPRPAWLPPQKLFPDPTFVDSADPQPDFSARKANTITEIARDLDSQRRAAFLADATNAIRAGRLAVMARACRNDPRGRGALMPVPPETVEMMARDLKGDDKKDFILGFLTTREALEAWYQPRAQAQAPTLDELWPAPDAPKETAPENAPAAVPDAASGEARPAGLAALEVLATDAALEEVSASEGAPAPDAGSAAPQRDGDEQFAPPKPRRRGRARSRSPVSAAAFSLFSKHPRPDDMLRGDAKKYFGMIARMLEAAGHAQVTDAYVGRLYSRFLDHEAIGPHIADTSDSYKCPEVSE
ncbi:hypothetical protein [Azospirillum sp. TSO35-2]|uniref:hypothetical protein n=1 Tax=Azospirillum sp. TSO35-2 TaxID=716796 RepID=UPI000D60BA65|nr:hypothetical protein [Azospirillum sp. TSO35-2]PWC39263.1 hypothetical protein TSO352_03450 [Azospirillum sp. TSO35-2]